MRLLLTTKTGEQWMGFLYKRDENKRIYVLRDLENCITGKLFSGRLMFDDDEIESVQDVVENTEINRNPTEDLENISTRRRLNLVMDRNSGRKEEIIIINRLNDQFFNVARQISREMIIGFAVEGRLIGRNGKICSLQILADNIIYIFDMMFLSKEFFQSGLKDILEDENIQKVIHDCRFVSDALYHTYGIVLHNVYDTQVADINIRKNNFKGKIPTTVRDLGTCLRDYLALKPTELQLFSAPQHLLKKEQIALTVRPFTDEVIASAADAVRYLRRLRLETLQRLLQELEIGIDVYLSHVRDSTPRDIALMNTKEVPEKMKLLLKGQQNVFTQPTLQPRTSSPLPSTNQWITNSSEWDEIFKDEDEPDKNSQQMQVLQGLKRLSMSTTKHSTIELAKSKSFQSQTSIQKDKKSPSSNSSKRKSSFPLTREQKTNDVTPSRLNLPPAGIQQSDIPKDLKRWEKLKQKNLI